MEFENLSDEWVQVAECDQFQDRDLLRVTTPHGDDVCLYRLGDEYFATHNRCTHGDAELSDGLIVEGRLIECPLHEGTFEIRTGLPVGAPCTVPIRTYALKVVDGAVFLQALGRRPG
jgi:nitrite reductase/ring-hydroxylating ferredoxin subunit